MGEIPPTSHRRFRKAIVGLTALFFGAWFVLSALEMRSYEKKAKMQVPHCANNLKIIGQALKQYSEDDKRELFPPLSPRIGRLTPEHKALYPEYFSSPRDYICPADVDRLELEDALAKHEWSTEVVDMYLDDNSYFYLGYLVVDDDDMELFAREYRKAMAEKRPMNEDYKYTDAPDAVMGGWLFRLRLGIERALFKDDSTPPAALMRRIPVLIERIDNHYNQFVGGNVLYLDGHVEFIEYPGKWPMTEKTVRILKELDALGAHTPVP